MTYNLKDLLLHEINKFNDGKLLKIENENPAIKEWEAWYKSNVKGFHDYTIYNGKKYIPRKLFTMSMAKKVSEDFANLLLNEKCNIVIPKDGNQEKLDQLLDVNNFWTIANLGIEKAFALGSGFLVESIDGLKVDESGFVINDKSGNLKIDFITATRAVPLIRENGKITDVAFYRESTTKTEVAIHVVDRRADSKTKGNYFVIILEVENLLTKSGEQNQYRKINRFEIDTQDKIAWFQVLSPNIANNINCNSNVEISVYANAIDSLRAVDNCFDALQNEISFGRRRIFVSEKLIDIDSNGQKIDRFDPNDIVYYTLPDQPDGKQLITDSAPALRTSDLVYALNEQLNILSSRVGMGENYYNYEVGKRIQTATQVISENSQMFRTIVKHEIKIRDALQEMVLAIISISNNFTPISFAEVIKTDIVVRFDDSIIEDKSTEKKMDADDLANKTMSNVQYRMKWYGEDEETATKKVGYLDICNMLEKCSLSLTEGLLPVDQFIKMVKDAFPYFDTNGLKESLEEKFASQNINPFEPITSDDEENQEDDQQKEDDQLNE